MLRNFPPKEMLRAGPQRHGFRRAKMMFFPIAFLGKGLQKEQEKPFLEQHVLDGWYIQSTLKIIEDLGCGRSWATDLFVLFAIQI